MDRTVHTEVVAAAGTDVWGNTPAVNQPLAGDPYFSIRLCL